MPLALTTCKKDDLMTVCFVEKGDSCEKLIEKSPSDNLLESPSLRVPLDRVIVEVDQLHHLGTLPCLLMMDRGRFQIALRVLELLKGALGKEL